MESSGSKRSMYHLITINVICESRAPLIWKSYKQGHEDLETYLIANNKYFHSASLAYWLTQERGGGGGGGGGGGQNGHQVSL